MAYALRPLSLGELLDNTFDIYRRNFLLFLGISAIPNCTLLLLQLAVVGTGTTTAGASQLQATGLGALPSAEFEVLFLGLASLIVTYFVTAATTFGVSEIYLNIPTSIRACYARVGGNFLRVVVVSFVVAVIIGFGTALCIIPGIYWTGKYGLAVPAVVLEKLTWRQALERSSRLAEGAFGRVIGVTFLMAIFIGVLAFALDAGIEALDSAVFHRPAIFSGVVAQQVISTIVSIFLNPVSAIALTLVYYDQRVRKEAFDLERMMSLMAPNDLASGAGAQ
jgi:hypothetical protein